VAYDIFNCDKGAGLSEKGMIDDRKKWYARNKT
jgi:hypothetical protein